MKCNAVVAFDDVGNMVDVPMRCVAALVVARMQITVLKTFSNRPASF